MATPLPHLALRFEDNDANKHCIHYQIIYTRCRFSTVYSIISTIHSTNAIVCNKVNATSNVVQYRAYLFIYFPTLMCVCVYYTDCRYMFFARYRLRLN